MKTIADAYPDRAKEEAESGSFYGPGDYTPLLESWGYEICVRVDDSDYQGDSRLILRNVERYGYLNFGWGSCSGCDALQACSTIKEIEDLRTTLHDSIRWGTKAELLKFFNEHDWEGDYSWHHEEQKAFIEQAKAFLAK